MRAIDEGRFLEGGFFSKCCCIFLLVVLGILGSISFFIPSVIFTSQLAFSKRPEREAAYNAAIKSWNNGGYFTATTLAQDYNFKLASAPSPLTLVPLTGVSATSQNYPPLQVNGAIGTFSQELVFQASGQLFPVVAGNSTSSTIIQSTVTIVATPTSGGGSPVTLSATLPIAFFSKAGADCAGSVTGDGCNCPSPYNFNTNTRKCEAWWIANGVCLVIEKTPSGTLQLATDTSIGSGCALNPAAYFSSGNVAFYAPVPTTDTCLAGSLNNLGPVSYVFSASGRPSVIAAFGKVQLRVAGDPYVTALSVSQGQTINNGATLTFGTPTSKLEALSAGLFSAFAVCFFIFMVWMTCTLSRFFDNGLERLHSRLGPGLSRDIVRWVGGIIAKTRTERCCRNGQACVYLAGGIIFGVLVAYSCLSFILLDANYVCAYRTIPQCGSSTPGATLDVVLSCGTMQDLRAASTLGANFRGLNLAAISLALVPIGYSVIVAAATPASGGAGAVLFFGTIVLFVICVPLSAVIQIAVAALYASKKTQLASDYCAYIASDLVQPTYCSTTTTATTLITAETVLGLIFFCFLCAFGVAKRRAGREALRRISTPRRRDLQVGEPLTLLQGRRNNNNTNRNNNTLNVVDADRPVVVATNQANPLGDPHHIGDGNGNGPNTPTAPYYDAISDEDVQRQQDERQHRRNSM